MTARRPDGEEDYDTGRAGKIRDPGRIMAVANLSHPPASELTPQEHAVVRKAAWRIMPFIIVCYIVSYLDRTNLSFAALTMMDSLGLTAAQFGFAAGIFFLGYIAFELPSNLLLVRFGARRWIARIMITWGLLAVAMAFVNSATSLYVLRILLGIAEAGFFPGLIFYLAYWFPAAYRARIFGWFLAAIPVSMLIGAPLSSSLLQMDGIAGLEGWQWLFIVEGMPAVFLGLACLKLLTDSPAEARWLNAEERETLVDLLERERGNMPQAGHTGIGDALGNPRMWQMALVNLGLIAGSYGIVFFLPQIVAEFGVGIMQNGFISALPFLAAFFAMLAWSWNSDRTGERRWHIFAPLACSAIGFVAAGLMTDPVLRTLGLILAAMGTYMAMGPFWQFVPTFLRRGKGAAAAVAIINMIGSLAGFFAPFAMGAIKDSTGDYFGGLAFTAVLVALGSLAVLWLTSGLRQATRPSRDSEWRKSHAES